MEQKAIVKSCKELGCCNACCLRYIGLKNPTAYENVQEFIQEYIDGENNTQVPETIDTTEESPEKSEQEDADSVPRKRMKTEDVCVSCIGVLQEESWPPCFHMVKEMLDKKRYECDTFACALSAPVATLLREKAIAVLLAERHAHYEPGALTPLKEAWKWSAGGALERHCGKTLDSGAVSPLLVTLHLEYPHDAAELDALRALAPEEPRPRHPRWGRGRGRGAPAGGGVTRRAAERALEGATSEALRAAGWLPPPRPGARVAPVSVAGAHAPLYLGGRYVKLSRALPQTPWVLRGERLMDSSVQEIIFEPLAALYGMPPEEAEHRLKFMSAGREDVDVRCLGTGRPFAVEVADPSRAPSAAELRALCERISASGKVVVESLVPVTREQLAELKRGEETKCKTYEALCIKLAHTAEEEEAGAGAGGAPVTVTELDLQRVRAWSGEIVQRTPLRVLHRRALAARRRSLRTECAARVARHPALFALRLRTDAGTYVKEWAHGDLRRTRPALAAALRAPADILALDVTHVHLDWPHTLPHPRTPTPPPVTNNNSAFVRAQAESTEG